MRASVVLIFTCCCMITGVYGQSTGSVIGAVLSPEGAGVTGASVRFVRIPRFNTDRKGRSPRLAPGERMYSRTARTGPNGSYRLDGLPVGRYHYCATPPSPLLDGCDWAARLFVNVGLGTLTLPAVRVARGALVRFELEDAGELAKVAGNSTGTPNLVLGVRDTGGAIHPAVVQGRAGRCMGKMVAPEICEENLPRNRAMLARRLYDVWIPSQTALTLWAFGPMVDLVGETGSSLSSAGPLGNVSLLPASTHTVKLRVRALRP